MLFLIDLVTVFDAILTSRKTCEKLQCLFKNVMSNNFRKTAVLKKKNMTCKLTLQNKGLLKNWRGGRNCASISPETCFRFSIYLSAIFPRTLLQTNV